MFHVHIGFDTYGRVKAVGRTPIVTRFFAVSFLPVIPMNSYYLAGIGRMKYETLTEGKVIQGYPLSSLNYFSVLMAYYRGFCAVLVLAGCVVIVPLFALLMGERLDEMGMMMVHGLLISLVVGIFLGLASYLPFPIAPREATIRRMCGTVLGVCADPALVRADVAEGIALEMQPHLVRAKDRPELEDSPEQQRLKLLCELVCLRAAMAGRGAADPTRESLEQETDKLLEKALAT